jgi:glycosyltransferase involved in cell wall biosynthesis
MRVLVIGDHDRIIGGAERFLHELILEAADASVEFTTLDLHDLFRDREIPCAYWQGLRDRWLADGILRERLMERIRSADAELIHLNTNAWRTATVFSALRRVSTPVVVFVHDAWILRRICLPGARKLFGAFHFMTHQTDYHKALSRCGLSSCLVRVPFRPSQWTAEADDAPKQFDLSYAGRVDRQKGMRLLLHAADRLIARHDEMKIAIAGEGDAYSWMVRQLRSMRLDDNVFMLGRLGDAGLARLYRQSKLLVLPSANESLGYVGLEAQSSGLPVVAFSNPGTRRWCIDGESGFLVDRRTPDALARRIDEVLDDDALRNRVAARALEVVRGGQYNASGLRVADAYRAILRPC